MQLQADSLLCDHRSRLTFRANAAAVRFPSQSAISELKLTKGMLVTGCPRRPVWRVKRLASRTTTCPPAFTKSSSQGECKFNTIEVLTYLGWN